MVGKINARILVDKFCRVTGGLIDDMRKGTLEGGRGCVDQVFTLKQISEKALEKKVGVNVGFIDLEKAYDRITRKVLW